MEQQKILVTGAAGLIGAEVYKKLFSLNYNVTGVDNLSRPGSRIQGEIINCNLLDFYNNYKNSFDIIFHFAAINGTENFYSNPNMVTENNIELDLATFKFAKKNNSKIIYASSSEVVAGTIELPTQEETDVFIENIHNSRWSYRLTKIVSENYLVNSNLNYLIVRFFNVFGADSRQGHFVFDIIDKIKRNDRKLTGARETRSFCYIDDAVKSLLEIFDKEQNKVLNIGNDEEISIKEAADIISEILFHKKVEWELIDSRPGSTSRRCPNIDKLRQAIPDYDPDNFSSSIEKMNRVLEYEEINIKN